VAEACDEWEVQVYAKDEDADDSDPDDDRYSSYPTPQNFLKREKKFARAPHPGFLLREKYSWVPSGMLFVYLICVLLSRDRFSGQC
jgi:hypothetical protein